MRIIYLLLFEHKAVRNRLKQNIVFINYFVYCKNVQNIVKMAESSELVSSHQKNISMLLDKLKELQMDTEMTSADSVIYSKVECEYFQIYSS